MFNIPVSQKFKVDTLFNIVGFGILGISGLGATSIIGKFYDASSLGVFNLTMALFVLFSQLTGAGIHFSVLTSCSKYRGSENIQETVLNNAFISSVAISLPFVLLIVLLKEIFSPLFDDRSQVDSIIYIIPALIFLSFNKIFFAFVNSQEKMKYLAFMNSLRGISLIAVLFSYVYFQVPGFYLCSIISFSEFILFIVFVATNMRHFHLIKNFDLVWIKHHMSYGIKSAVGSFFIDVNTKVDILLLGYFLSDRAVGIYSLPALIMEGFNQLPIVFRTLINPKLTVKNEREGRESLRQAIIKGKSLTYKFVIPIGIMVLIAFPIALYLFNFDVGYYEGVVPLIILMAGTLISVGYAPFLMLFNQVEMPVTQSLLYILIFMVNLVFNLLFIPIWGITGSAIGTAISAISIMVFLKFFARKYLYIRI